MDEIEKNAVLLAVRKRLEDQTKKGLVKYGRTIDPELIGPDELLEHALQELADLSVYLEAVKQKVEGNLERYKHILSKGRD